MLGERYELLEKVGEGGAAVVYRARDVRLDRFVAVKVLREQHAADPGNVARFRREAQAAASLTHPNVVPVYDYGQDGDTHYIVLEYLPGPTLKEHLRSRGALPVGEAVAIARQVLAGLQAAHAQGLVHRDVKPQNVLFAGDGSAKVSDFGIARALAAPSLTATGEAMGTAHYLSPEQARGEPVGPASDVYSAGVVLYEMLAGRLPFDGETGLAIALKHVSEPPPALSQVAPGVPPGLERIVMRALAKDPAQRWSDAAAMAKALADYGSAAQQVTATFRPTVGSSSGVAPTLKQSAVVGPASTRAGAGLPEPRAPAARASAACIATRARLPHGRPLLGSLAALFLAGFLLSFCAGTGLLITNRSAAGSILGGLAGADGRASSPPPPSPTWTPAPAALLPTTTRPAATATASPHPSATPSPTATPTATATSTPTATPQPTPTRAASQAVLDVRAFAGGCRVGDSPRSPMGREFLMLYGQKSNCPQASASFDLPVRPVGEATLALLAASSPGDSPEVAVVVNDRTVVRGELPLPERGAWGEVAWRLPEGTLRQGRNAVTVANLSRGKQGSAPWLGLAGAVVGYR